MTELEVRIEETTERLVRVTNLDTMQSAWLPLAQIDFDLSAADERTIIVLPDWLACERGLV